MTEGIDNQEKYIMSRIKKEMADCKKMSFVGGCLVFHVSNYHFLKCSSSSHQDTLFRRGDRARSFLLRRGHA